MEMFTFGSEGFMEALIKKMQSEDSHYGINLNMTDFKIFTIILRELALYGEVGRSARVEVAEILGNGTDDLEPIEEWAWMWLSDIGDTLDIEGV